MLNLENTLLVIVDVQGNLAHSMYRKEVLFKNIRDVAHHPVIGVPHSPLSLTSTHEHLFICMHEKMSEFKHTG